MKLEAREESGDAGVLTMGKNKGEDRGRRRLCGELRAHQWRLGFVRCEGEERGRCGCGGLSRGHERLARIKHREARPSDAARRRSTCAQVRRMVGDCADRWAPPVSGTQREKGVRGCNLGK